MQVQKSYHLGKKELQLQVQKNDHLVTNKLQMQVDTIYYRFENFIDVGTKKFSLGRKYLQIQEPKKNIYMIQIQVLAQKLNLSLR